MDKINGFGALGLDDTLVRAVQAAGYEQPTAVQAQALPAALQGRDLMVSSATGSGKTAAYVLPALTMVLADRAAAVAARQTAQAAAEPAPPPRNDVKGAFGRHDRRNDRRPGPRPQPTGPRVLVLAPTRELALQVTKAFIDHGRFVPGLRVASIVGGVPYAAQLRALAGPLDVLVATPGRLMDHMASGRAVLARVGLLVLDEADRMLDMGFIDDIRHIAEALPAERQTLMTSATFAGSVGALAQTLLRSPQRVEVASHTEAHADIEQRLHWADDFAHKNALLDHILTERSIEQAVVFTSTQRDADWLADRLGEMGHSVAALHGGMPQGRRNRVLQGLRERRLRVLVATDVAARGIDVPTISHVINFGLPMKEEDYVHRIGRTGRAGRAGLAVTLAERRDAGMVHRIQRFTTQRIPPATIAGLEPRRPEPPPRAERAAAGRPGKPFGARPGAGAKPAGRGGFGRPAMRARG
ncbi:MAG: DEAD/DEAH box helicase [Rubrivivax sp.]|nr:DEAD/DEAH box helicase [Rubrivivax sp.]